MSEVEAAEVRQKLGRWREELNHADTVNRAIALQLIEFGEWAAAKIFRPIDLDGEISV